LAIKKASGIKKFCSSNSQKISFGNIGKLERFQKIRLVKPKPQAILLVAVTAIASVTVAD